MRITRRLLILYCLCWAGTAWAEETDIPAEPSTTPAYLLLNQQVAPGSISHLHWSASQNFTGMNLYTPVLVAHGTKAGPTLCLAAAIHGDELNGIEIVRRVVYHLDPKKLSGTLIGIPIVNLHGFQRSSRYLADRRDLNRHFPGSTTGSSAARIAFSFFEEIIKHCDALVDIHTGSFHRTNLTQVRADLGNPEVRALTQGFGATPVLDSPGVEGSLRRAATDSGTPTVTMEVGEPNRLQIKLVDQGTQAIGSLMNELGMLDKRFTWNDPQPIFYESRWVRVDSGGILISRVQLGARVKIGQLLGTVTDPITNAYTEVQSPYSGRVLGMALNQVVMPGYAAYHIGIERSEEELVSEHEAEPEPGQPDPDADTEHDANGDLPEEADLPK